ncbi:DNA internalization-related competence protein ComEC/Rec2 [Colwellia sp. MEBiC06753]
MEWWLLGFILGAILSFLAPSVPVIFYECLLIIAVIYWLACQRHRLLLSTILGFLWMFFHGASYNSIWQDNQLTSSNYFYQPHQAVFTIVDLPVETDLGWRFTAFLEQLDKTKLKRKITIKLNWQQAERQLRNGDKFSAWIKLKPAHGLANLGSFSYQRWLRSEGIHATGYVQTTKAITLLASSPNIRDRFYQRVKNTTQPFEHQALLVALSFGDRSLFSNQTWSLLQQTGTQHLVAISGLHIGLVVSFSFIGSLSLFRLLPLTSLSRNWQLSLSRCNVVYLALAIALIVSAGYSYLAGFAIPTIRALIFFTTFCVSHCLALKLSPTKLIVWAMAITVLLLPASLYSTSFWLSYGAVAIIFLLLWRFNSLLSGQHGWRKALWILVIIQCGLSIFLLPLNAIIFQQISTVSIAANFIAVPVASLIIMPLLFVSLLATFVHIPAAQQLFSLLNTVLDYLVNYLTWLASFNSGALHVSAQQSNWLIAATLLLMVIIFMLIKLSKINVVTGLLSLVYTIIFTVVAKPLFVDRTGHWQVNVLDVGQGLSVIIEQQQSALLYDTGQAYPSGWSMAEQVILPFVAAKDIQLEYVVISHNDQDHAGGLKQVLAYDANSHNAKPQVFYNQPIDGSLLKLTTMEPEQEDRQSPYRSCTAGKQIIWHQLKIKVLWPLTKVGDKNDESCVLLIDDGKTKLLLTGDITTKVERQLLALYPELKADVLIAPHHGSKSSSSRAFIRALQPKAVIFSSGFYNRWRMPAADVVARFQALGVQHFSTAAQGMITVNIAPNTWNIVTYRNDLLPYWFAN